jgi:hypothetical protein
VVDIVDSKIPSTSIDAGQKLHLHVECDQPSPPIWVVDSLDSYDFLDSKFPSKEAILKLMVYIDNPTEDENNHTFILPNLGLTRVNMMSFDPGLGAFTGASSEFPPSILQHPWMRTVVTSGHHLSCFFLQFIS